MIKNEYQFKKDDIIKKRNQLMMDFQNKLFGISEDDIIQLYKNGSLDVEELLSQNRKQSSIITALSNDLMRITDKYNDIKNKYDRLLKNINIMIDSYDCIKNEVNNEK